MSQQEGVGATNELLGGLAELARAEDERWHEDDDVKGRALRPREVFRRVEGKTLAGGVGEEVVGELLFARVMNEVIVA